MWPYPTMLAHRGGGTLAPENTIAALACGFAYGFRAVEFDVMLARDGVPVLMHDPYLGRTVAAAGHVFDYAAAELQQMDAGSWFAARFAGEPVPLFAEVAAFCQAHGIWMNIEIKPAPGFEAATGAAVASAAGRLAGAPLLSSFSETALAAAAAAAPATARALLFDAVPADWLARARRLGVVAIHCNHKRLDGATAAAIKDAGLGLLCYTVNTVARARSLFAMGVDAICTDRIDLLTPDLA
ncbi:glycerophosphodiester phosphodiesterase [Massilia sp. PWRC2]|uniref:glycerophosphodiester phosphodiesterase n=1 Tax=Massilia sp. PWRC2 TaxID=2804626 RepID=UPI003CEA9343